uniref:Reverse transcriptase domain-containing protein n=1 Tax=Tanacetum cinerariifolium TaxID=118510 RepID=A0A6L2N5T4_TANCI|nr:hypothetical protein [Tanacetum cinerariifolium]
MLSGTKNKAESRAETYSKQEEKWIEEEQAANARYWKIPACCDDDDDYNSAITPNEPIDSLSMRDEHLNTIPAMESDEFIKSCVENLVQNPKKIFSNPLFEEEIISMKIDPHHFNAESDLIESLLNHDSSIIPSSSKIDSLLDEFTDIRLIERLLYDNSSPRKPKEFVFKNSNADIGSFSPSLIPVEDNDTLMEKIDLFITPDDPMPPSIEEDDYDSERDILILAELPSNYSLSLLENESFYFDIPLFSRPPEKSLDLLSHRGLEIFQPSAKCPMMIHGKNIPILDVPLSHFYPLDQLNIPKNVKALAKRILSSKSSFPQLQLGINLLHLAGSQPMLKSSYKAEDGVIISIPPLVRGVKDKRENGKIGTKPDENKKRGKAQQCQKPIIVKQAEKEKKIQTKRTKNANPRSCIEFKLKTRADVAIYPKFNSRRGILPKCKRCKEEGLATSPTLAITLKGLTYLGFNLPRLPNRTTPFQGRSFPLFLESSSDQSVELLQLRLSTQHMLHENDL